MPALYSDRELAGNCINECLHKCQRREKKLGSEGRAELEVVMLQSGAPFLAHEGHCNHTSIEVISFWAEDFDTK